MISQCGFSPDPIWVREVNNGICHVTLRRNITEKDLTNMDGTTEKQYQFEEMDIQIPDREDIDSYVSANFDQLFMSNLTAYKENKIQQINNTCNSTIYAGFKASNGHTYKFDLNYQNNFNQTAIMFSADSTMTQVTFNTQDAGMIVHTKDEFMQVCKDAATFKTEMLDKYFNLQGQIENATDYLSVDAINWQ